ncbi:hypothetical protein [uncultured Chitinophaga sp.]|jgi:hypothetical protein|uniref:hypothetical protein n=1 Tax=uncultured Chitinophaga sp. TaxID=339340 RepID=UPI0026246966|nr:hypothetical protein [uncultured Chitinophaga sp.]
MKRFFQMSCGITYALLFTAVFAMVSCSKEGDAGPAGPEGPAGPAGAAGPKGDAGSANVIYSDWLDASYTTEDDSVSWVAEIDAPKLTTEILSKGEIKVYVNLAAAENPAIVPLPYFDGAFLINVQAVESAIILISNADLSTYIHEASGKKVQQVRYVLIPGGTAARQSAGIDWNDYQQVKKYLNLKD